MNTISDQLDGPSAGIVGEPVDLDTFADALGGMPTDLHGAATMRRMHAEHLHAATNRPPVGPCPPWCEEPSGHDWESYDSGVYFQRTHLVDVGAVQVVTTENIESASYAGLMSAAQRLRTTEPLKKPKPAPSDFINGQELSDNGAGQLRQLAAEALNAADVLDGLAG